jgi:beta-galactosidase
MRRLVLRSAAAGAFALAAACSSSDAAGPAAGADAGPGPMTFPAGFLFGAAVAGFQVDMGCPTLPASACEDPNSDWYQFVTSPKTVGDPKAFVSGQKPSLGPGHWELYPKDVELLAGDVHLGALRFSIEWSRVFPTSTEGVEGQEALSKIANHAALDHYHALLAALKAKGVKPLVTLNHYTLPTWIHDGVGCHVDLDHCSPRGWLDADRTIEEIAKYAGFCAKEFGAEVDLWATLNEPFAVVLPGYMQPTADRSNPPAVGFRFKEARVVMNALEVAHARMYDAVKAGDTADADGDGKAAEVGLVYAMSPVAPADPENPVDVAGAKNLFYLWNMVFLNAVAKGDQDADLTGKPVHRDDLAGRMDYIGINYYTRITAQGTTQPFLTDLSPLSTFNPLTVKPWEDYPKGIYEMAMIVKNELHLPAIVTENGAADPKDDGTGPSYLVRHATWLARAIADGADVRGYFWWSLMDNYEWNHGMDVRMGLYAVDPADPKKARVARQGVAVFRAIADARAIPADLAAKYPAP